MDNITDFVPTRSSALNSKAKLQLQVVEYKTHKSKKRPSSPDKIVNEPLEPTFYKTVFPKNLDMKRARHEIVKFGMSGFDPDRKEEAKIQLAVKLGAKPPKNKYTNYKTLLAERKERASKVKEAIEYQQLGKNAVGKSVAKGKSFDRKRKKEKSGILDTYGKATLSNTGSTRIKKK